jgi:serine/threonine protein kinase
MIVFNILDSLKIIDIEINKLDKKSDKEIDDLYETYIEKHETKINPLYDMFEPLYKNKLFISYLISILKNHKLPPLNLLSFVDEIDYIKNFGYNKIKHIGQGEYGTVYLAKKNKKKYAIKIQLSNDFYSVEQNINEYETLKKLNKYSISPKVYDIKFILNESTMDVYSLIFMEHIDGITLTQYITKKGKLDDTDKKKLNETITKLHKLGIYHRDLHSDNIIVVKKSKNYDFIMIDLGLAVYRKDILNNANKFNKKVLIEKSPTTLYENKKLYIALTNCIKKGTIDVYL